MTGPHESTAPAIRVGLEVGYDYGRAGAWMLDLPGCFVWGRDRAVALARVPSAVGAFASWLAAHGETIEVPETDRIVVAEELQPSLIDGYERNVTFAADRRAVSDEELDAAVRRLGFARDDLVALADCVDAWECERGALEIRDDQRHAARPSGDQMTERTSADVLRHIGGAEIWLAGRLAPGVRYNGPSRDSDARAWLAATRSWALQRVREVHAANPAVAGTDAKGEEWTLAKVLRRLVYHSLDHLGEVDRRLAQAEHAVDRLLVRRDVLVSPDDLGPLLRAVGWYRLIGDPARLARLIEGSTEMISAWDRSEMVGFARALHDDAAYGLITTVAVHPRWQGKGLARRLIGAILENNDQIRFSLSAVPGVESLYASVGFVPDGGAMVRRRLV